VITKQPVHVTDLRQEATYKAGFPPLVALVDKGGARTLLIVPMAFQLLLAARRDDQISHLRRLSN
jgi:hypothetical protein